MSEDYNPVNVTDMAALGYDRFVANLVAFPQTHFGRFLMLKGFTPSPDKYPDSFTLPLAPKHPDREPVQILIIGSEPGIASVIHRLYLCRFAEVHEWTILLPAPVPGKLMRSLTRYVDLN